MMRDLARLGALWLLVVGMLLFTLGTLFAAGLAYAILSNQPCSPPVGCAALPFLAVGGAIVAAIGAGHLAASYGVWTGRGWGRWLGAALATVGVGAGLLLLPEPGEMLLWGMLVAIGYGVTLVGIVASVGRPAS